jgi:hypothetical protein
LPGEIEHSEAAEAKAEDGVAKRRALNVRAGLSVCRLSAMRGLFAFS